jgi:hypothetical protein
MMSTSIWLSPVHQILNSLISTICILSFPTSFEMPDSSTANTTTGYPLQARNWFNNNAVSYLGSFLLNRFRSSNTTAFPLPSEEN